MYVSRSRTGRVTTISRTWILFYDSINFFQVESDILVKAIYLTRRIELLAFI